MNAVDRLILVVNHRPPSAENLKELIEFMDAPPVCIAAPDNWQAKLGENRLAALFVGNDLDDDEVSELISAVGRLDPNVPIVMLNPESVQ